VRDKGPRTEFDSAQRAEIGKWRDQGFEHKLESTKRAEIGKWRDKGPRAQLAVDLGAGNVKWSCSLST